jgi:Holliday junction resolvase
MSSWGKMNSNKSQGSAFERAVLKHLQLKGYYACRSAGSHQIVDILAIGRGGVSPSILFIQCKRGGALSPAEWNELFTTAQRYRARPLLAQAGKRGKGPSFFELTTPKVPKSDLPRAYDGEKEIYVP